MPGICRPRRLRILLAQAGFPQAWSTTDRRTPAFNAQFERAARIAHRQYQLLIGDEYGVHWRQQYALSESDDDGAGMSWDYAMLRDLFPAARELKPSENPFPAKHVCVDTMMFIEPSVYLNALLRDFYIAGGRIRRVAFEDARQLGGLSESIVVNCTGWVLASYSAIGSSSQSKVSLRRCCRSRKWTTRW